MMVECSGKFKVGRAVRLIYSNFSKRYNHRNLIPIAVGLPARSQLKGESRETRCLPKFGSVSMRLWPRLLFSCSGRRLEGMARQKTNRQRQLNIRVSERSARHLAALANYLRMSQGELVEEWTQVAIRSTDDRLKVTV
jgi:hypothetical protein